MKKLTFGCFLAVSVFSFAAAAEQMTGFISDAMCGAKHTSASAASSKCVEKCIGGGSDPVLVSDGKVIKLDGDSKDKAKALAGKNVTVDGTMDGDALKITSISEAK
jgi:hypothetical protein